MWLLSCTLANDLKKRGTCFPATKTGARIFEKNSFSTNFFSISQESPKLHGCHQLPCQLHTWKFSCYKKWPLTLASGHILFELRIFYIFPSPIANLMYSPSVLRDTKWINNLLLQRRKARRETEIITKQKSLIFSNGFLICLKVEHPHI